MSAKFIPILVVLACAGPTNIVHAVTWKVPTQASTIAAALESTDVTLVLVEGTHEEPGRVTMKSGVSVTVDPDHPGLPTIDANDDTFAVVFPEVSANTTLDGFRLIGFTVRGVGIEPGIFGTREVRNCVVEGTGSEQCGILVDNAKSLISNVRISGFTGSDPFNAGIAIAGDGGLNIPMTVEKAACRVLLKSF